MKRLTLLLLLAATCLGLGATELPKGERQSILDAIRPKASEEAGQAVRIKVDRLNVDGGWAVLVGGLVSASGKGMDWGLANGCHPDLDKMLWVVLQKTGGAWRVKHLDICASEPPYWYMEQYGGLVWPCGVYAGLGEGSEGTLERQCRQQARRRP
ncbi:hypothetical protein [Rhizobacter sp. Root1221]|uniref:hypothetical protein n=1 Tax=Rhizobacter sp. Root1221 TaxID=1736433 RepID=UPI0006FE9699|nr:hypothetical protein [Rhizobacter sp. Root1221]KQV78834.1 hypothetical protein ASC87_10875 [Rhizobacter sp. Root1221]